MKNKFFPEWKEANDFLNAFVDEHFGIYASMPTPDTCYITVLPEDKLANLVPVECCPAINERARKFTKHINKVLKRHNFLEDIPDDISINEKEIRVRKRMESFFVFYESLYGISVIVALKHYLGLRLHYDATVSL